MKRTILTLTLSALALAGCSETTESASPTPSPQPVAATETVTEKATEVVTEVVTETVTKEAPAPKKAEPEDSGWGDTDKEIAETAFWLVWDDIPYSDQMDMCLYFEINPDEALLAMMSGWPDSPLSDNEMRGLMEEACG